MIELTPMCEVEFEEYLKKGVQIYAEENVKAGHWIPEEALEKSTSAHQKLLPQGLATPKHYLFMIEDTQRGEKVGVLWLEADSQSPKPDGFIYDLLIYEPYRRQGYATQAMLALEDKAREMGLQVLSLHVFAHNPNVKALYDPAGLSGDRLPHEQAAYEIVAAIINNQPSGGVDSDIDKKN